MSDKKFLHILTTAHKAIAKQYKTKVCKAISPSCVNCQAQILLGYLQDQINLMEWSLKSNKGKL